MGEIFSKVTVLRKDLYPTLINQMIAAGWTKLNEGHPTTASYCDVMQAPSAQEGNNKQIWMLAPFDGNDALNISTYNNRTTTYSNGIICYCSGYNSTTGLGIPFKGSLAGSWENFSFLRNTRRRDDSPTGGYARTSPMDAMVDLYFNIGPEYVAFGTLPQSLNLSKMEGCFTYFGRPEDCYLEESTGVTPYVMHASTGHSQFSANNAPMFYHRPRNFKPNTTGRYQGACYFINPGAYPNIDGVYSLSDMYVGRSDEGIRFRIGNGFMFVGASPELTGGDLIEVTENGVTKLYVYIIHTEPGSSIKGIPTNTFALRIQ